MANIRFFPLWACQSGLIKSNTKKKRGKNQKKINFTNLSDGYVVQFLSYTKVKQVCLKLLIILLPVYILKEL